MTKPKFKAPKQGLADRSQPVVSTVMGKIATPATPAAKPINYNTVLGGSRGK